MTSATYIRVEQQVGSDYWRTLSNEEGNSRFDDTERGRSEAIHLYLHSDRSSLKRIVRVHEDLEHVSIHSSLNVHENDSFWKLDDFMFVYHRLLDSMNRVTIGHSHENLTLTYGLCTLSRCPFGRVRWDHASGAFGYAGPFDKDWISWMQGGSLPNVKVASRNDIHTSRDV